MYIYFQTYEIKFTWIRKADLGRHGLGGDHVLFRDLTHLQYISS